MKKFTLIFCSVFLLSFVVFNFSCEAITLQQSAGGGTNPVPAGGGTNPAGTQSNIPTLQNPLKAKNVTDVLLSLVDIAIFIGVIVAVFMFIYIGFKFVLAQGDSKKLGEARSWFFYAVIGTAILISSKVIVEVVKTTLISAGVVDQKLFNQNL